MKDSHEDLINACLEYIKWYEKFEYGLSDEAGIKARNALQKIKALSQARREEIQAKRKVRRAARKGMRGKPLRLTKGV